MIQTGYVFTHSHTAKRTVAFEAVRLELAGGGQWSKGRWVFLSDGEPVVLGCDVVDEISVEGAASFPVTIVEPEGTHGPFVVQGMMSGEPSSAHCFLFSEAANGFWVGTTVSSSYGKVILRDYECDPT